MTFPVEKRKLPFCKELRDGTNLFVLLSKFVLSVFLAKSSLKLLFEELKDYQVTLHNGIHGQRSFTLDTCKDLTFEDVAEGSFIHLEYNIQDKFNNASLLNFVNLFGKHVMKPNGDTEDANEFLQVKRDGTRELVILYVDDAK